MTLLPPAQLASKFLVYAGLLIAAPILGAQPAEPVSATETPQSTRDAITSTKAREFPIFTLYFENDYFGGTDRNYTNGLKFSWLTRDLTTWGQDGWRERFVEALPFVNRPEGQKNLGFAFGQNIYTPADTERVVPDPTDRPYAGWSYLEFSFLSKTATVADVLAVQIGLVGRHSYAQDVQRVFHEWINDDRPNGWEYQLKDEVGVNVVFERKWRWWARALEGQVGVDIIPHLGASLGNVQTFANAGATARLGLNLPSDFGTQIIRAGGAVNSPLDDADPRVGARRSWSFYLFGGVDGRAVARDIFLDGNTFRDSPSVDKEPFVADVSYGVGIVAGRWQVTYTRVIRTREFEAQTESSYDFGSVTISRAF